MYRMNIKITKVELDDILANKDKYNVSNLSPIENYEEVLSWTNTNNWIHSFHKNIPTIVVNTKNDLKWICDASKIGCISQKFSSLYREELEDFCNKYNNFNSLMKDGVFVRTEHVSLKTGIHGIGPYYNIKNIIESICTSTFSHAAIKDTDTQLNIYLLPWLNIDIDKEFRVFICGDKITGISVQRWYKQNKWLSTFTEEQIVDLIKRIKNFFENEFLKKWGDTKMSEKTTNFTIDLVMLEDNSFYFIEANPFGAEYAAGSSLFHWTIDKVLYNNNGIIEFRYC